MAQLIIMITVGAVGVLIAGLFWFLPRLSRPDLYYSVTVPPGFRDDPMARAILSRYRAELLIVSVLALAVVAWGDARLGPEFVPAGYFIQVAASFTVFFRARRRVLPYGLAPTSIREADLRGPTRIVPGGIFAAAGPFVLLLACAGYLWSTGRQARGAVYLLATGSLLSGLGLMLHGLVRWVRPVHAGGPEGARELKFRRAAAWMTLGLQYFLAVQASWVALIGGGHEPKSGKSAALAPLGLVLALVAVVVLARLRQGGVRGRPMDAGRPIGDRTPDTYWKLGIFYFNPEDQAVIIEKRFGLGYTFNFARPAAWIIIGLVLVGALIPVAAGRLVGRG